MLKSLREARVFSIDAAKIAEGMLDMFTDDERVVLRFGMLPAEKMRLAEKCLRDKFLEKARKPEPLPDGASWDGDTYTCYCRRPNDEPGFDIVEFSMKKLVQEAVHEIALHLYKIGDLVV